MKALSYVISVLSLFQIIEAVDVSGIFELSKLDEFHTMYSMDAEPKLFLRYRHAIHLGFTKNEYLNSRCHLAMFSDTEIQHISCPATFSASIGGISLTCTSQSNCHFEVDIIPGKTRGQYRFTFEFDPSWYDGLRAYYVIDLPFARNLKHYANAIKAATTVNNYLNRHCRFHFMPYSSDPIYFACHETVATSVRAVDVTCGSELDCEVRLRLHQGKTLGQHRFSFELGSLEGDFVRYMPNITGHEHLDHYSAAINSTLQSNMDLKNRCKFRQNILKRFFSCHPRIADTVHAVDAECESDSNCHLLIRLKPGVSTIGATTFTFTLATPNKRPAKYTTDVPSGHMQPYLDAIGAALYNFNHDTKSRCDSDFSSNQAYFSCPRYDSNVRALKVVCSNESSCKIHQIQWTSRLERVWHTGQLFS